MINHTQKSSDDKFMNFSVFVGAAEVLGDIKKQFFDILKLKIT